MKQLVQLIALAIWITGIVVAKGVWSTFFAVIIPFWSWYLTIEYFLFYG
jgi:hypothetical protein